MPVTPLESASTMASHLRSAEEVSQTRQELERKIVHSIEETVRLQGELNMLTPIFAIPEDVLEEIFMVLAALSRKLARPPLQPPPKVRRGQPVPRPPSYAWLKATHVCRHWRDVALRSRRLWNTVVLTAKDCVEAMAMRSGTMLLTVDDGGNPLNINVRARLIESLIPHMDRVQSLDITISPFKTYYLHRLVKTDTPQLTSLTINNPPGCNRTDFGQAKEFIAQSHPVLDSIAFSGYSFRSLAPLLEAIPNITRLSLSKLPDTETITTEKLAAVIAGFESLRELNLVDALPIVKASRSVTALPGPKHPFILPNLRSIHLAGSDYSSVSFFNEIIFPSTTVVSIGLTARKPKVHWTFPAIVQPFVSKLLVNGVIDTDRPILSVAYEVTPKSNEVVLQGWTTIQSLDALVENTKAPNFTLAIAVGTASDPNGFLHEFCKEAPLQSVQTLRISDDARPDSIAFSSYTNLQGLCLASASPYSLAKVLAPEVTVTKTKDKGIHKDTTIPNPCLENIVLHSISFCSRSKNPAERREFHWCRDFFIALEERKWVGARRPNLSVRNAVSVVPNVTFSKHRQSLVEVFEWDGSGANCEPEDWRIRNAELDSDDEEYVEEYVSDGGREMYVTIRTVTFSDSDSDEPRDTYDSEEEEEDEWGENSDEEDDYW